MNPRCLVAFACRLRIATPVAVSNQWARYLLNYLYAVSDEDYDDDDTVSTVDLESSRLQGPRSCDVMLSILCQC